MARLTSHEAVLMRGDYDVSRQRRSQRRYPERQKARETLNSAVRRGILIRPDRCSRCAVPCKPNGHHENYAAPLEVSWLCSSCHGLEHRDNPNRKREAGALKRGRPQNLSDDGERLSRMNVKLYPKQIAWLRKHGGSATVRALIDKHRAGQLLRSAR